MNLDPLEAEVLAWLLDDFEVPKTLAGACPAFTGSCLPAVSSIAECGTDYLYRGDSGKK